MRLQDLPPDLHASLSLVLSQRKSYATLAAMLGIEERAVHDRAHAALALLAPRQARELSAAQREQVGEYLLAQVDPAQEGAARAYLESSLPARTWAQALSAQLAPLASGALPEVPAGKPEVPAVEPEVPAAEPQEPAPESSTGPSSRRGGAIVLGALAAIVVLAVVLIVGLGGGSHSSGTTSTSSSAPSTETSSTSTETSTTSAETSSTPAPASSTTTSSKSGKASGEPHLDATLTLTPPDSSSKALGLVEVVSQNNEHAFLIAAEHLPPTKGFRYAAWLYNSQTEAVFLGGGPTVGSNGLLKAAGSLPPNAGSYSTIVLTEERSEKPTQPGPIVLHGAFKLS